MSNGAKYIGSTCLEQKALQARQDLLSKNKWYYSDNEYTKDKIDEEYDAFTKASTSLTY